MINMNSDREIRKDVEHMRKTAYVSRSPEISRKITLSVEKERREVIRLWNEGKSLRDIAMTLQIHICKVEKHFERFEIIYGIEPIRNRAIPYEIPKEAS